MGCADGNANGINTVHLAFVVEQVGHALIAHRLWVPAFQPADQRLRRLMGLPASMRRARTKGRIAIDLLAQALRDGAWFDLICGDEVYGNCPILRAWAERIGQAYVLRVPKNFTLDFGPRVRFTCARAVTEFASATWELPQRPGTTTAPQRPTMPQDDPIRRAVSETAPKPATNGSPIGSPRPSRQPHERPRDLAIRHEKRPCDQGLCSVHLAIAYLNPSPQVTALLVLLAGRLIVMGQPPEGS